MSVTTVEGLMIGGERMAAAEGRTVEVLSPATATALAEVAEGGAEDANRAVAAARTAYETWSALSPVTRGRHMHRFANMVEQHAEELALIECRNVGMPFGEPRGALSMILPL